MPGPSAKTILVVEDERRIREPVCKYLEKHGFACIPLEEGRNVAAYLERVDLLLLDLNLPDIDGLDVLKQIRERSRLPIIILSARGNGEERILGLGLGADDYLVKPVLPGELVARVKALLRRSSYHETPAEGPGEFSFDQKARLVRMNGIEVSLTEQEFELVRFLVDSPGQTFTRQELLNLVWREEGTPGSRRVDLTVSRIRIKFADQHLESPIESIFKVGYRLAKRQARNSEKSSSGRSP